MFAARYLASRLARPTSMTCSLTAMRSITVSSPRHEIFTVQDKADFEERVTKSKDSIVLDFYATWCGPCKTLGPRLETVIASTKGKVHLAKIDIDANDELAQDWQVSSIPTIVGIKNGKVVGQFVGAKDEDELRAFVKQLE